MKLKSPSRTVILAVILLTTATLWMVKHRQLHAVRTRLTEAQALQGVIVQPVAEYDSTLADARRDLEAQLAQYTQARAAAAAASRELAEFDPETQWAAPPRTLPEWNDDSPYVWLKKEMVPQFPVQVFGDAGELNSHVASVLTLETAPLRNLNENLTHLLQEYRDLEASKVEFMDEHLPGIDQSDGPKVTIRIPPLPEEGAYFKRRFETTLFETLGEQRAGMIARLGREWLDSQFSQFGTEPKTISIVRHPNGTHNIGIRAGHGYMSVGGPVKLDHYIPSHLLPLVIERLNDRNEAEPLVQSP